MKHIKSKSVKLIAAFTATALLCGGTGAIAYAAGSNDASPSISAGKAADSSVTYVAAADSSSSDAAEALNASPSKDETVYVLAGSDGSVNKIIVSDWLQNAALADSLSDFSLLSDIENVKGDENLQLSGDGTALWTADGNDIYYQGTSTDTLPVSIDISYELDGTPITADELAGKSGKVTIHYTYTNTKTETVDIDGTSEEVYVPFAMITGMVLDNDVFTNVTISNGKLINDGDRTLVLGFAFPGLSDNLKLDSETIAIPDSFEITADVSSFSLATTMTLALNDVFSSFDMSKTDELSGLTGSMNDMTDAMDALINGSGDLYDGLISALAGSKQLGDGLSTAAAGTDELNAGAKTAAAGADTLSDGLSELSGGLLTLSSSNTALTAGAKATFDALLSTADTSIAASGLSIPALTIENYQSVLKQTIASLSEDTVYQTALDTVTAAVNEKRSVIEAQVTASVREKVLEGVLASLSMTKDTYDAAIAAGLIDDATQKQINAAVNAQMQSEDIQNTIQSYTDQQAAALIEQNMQSAEVTDKLDAAAAGRVSLTSLLTQLDSYQTFYQGILTYTEGVASAYDGSKSLTAGAKQLSSGLAQLTEGTLSLSSGIHTLYDGSVSLTSGLTDLSNGSSQLADGLVKFNEEAVQKLVDVINGSSGNLISRLKATIEAASMYNNYSGISDTMNGSVKFIFKTDSIGE